MKKRITELLCALGFHKKEIFENEGMVNSVLMHVKYKRCKRCYKSL